MADELGSAAEGEETGVAPDDTIPGAESEQDAGMPPSGEEGKETEGQEQTVAETTAQETELAEMAEELGLDPDDVKAMQEDPRRMIGFLEERIAALGAHILGAGGAGAAPPAGPGQGGQDANRGSADVPADAMKGLADAALKLEFEDSSLDEQSAKALRAIEKSHNAQLAHFGKLLSRLDGVANTVELMRTAREIDRFDSLLAAVPEELKETFGEGATADLRPTSKQLKARMGLSAMMDALAAGYERLRQPISQKALFEHALRAVTNPDVYKRSARAKIAKGLQKRSAQRIGSGAGASKVPGSRSDEKAQRTASAKFGEMGLNDDQ